MLKTIPCMKFPTLYIIIDDNPKFLTNFSLSLENDISSKTFSSPIEALAFIKEQEINLKAFIKKYFVVEADEPEPDSSKINFNSLYKAVHDKSRFLLSAVAITDYAMNKMTGAELCGSITDRNIKFIMLTGEAGYDIAVASFNQKEIDQFVLKDDPEYYNKIIKIAHQLEDEFFQEISRSILTAMGDKCNLFTDRNFIKFFNEFVKENDIVEFYLIEASGTYLMIDSKGNKLLLIGKDEVDMRCFEELAIDDAKAMPIIAEYFRRREKLTFFPPNSIYINPTVSAEYWPLVDAKKIELENKNYYYYGVVRGLDNYFKISDEKIYSYHDFNSESNNEDEDI